MDGLARRLKACLSPAASGFAHAADPFRYSQTSWPQWWHGEQIWWFLKVWGGPGDPEKAKNQENHVTENNILWRTCKMSLKSGWPTDEFATWGAQVTPKSVQRYPKTAIRLRKWGQKLIQNACRSSFLVFSQNLEIWQHYNDFNGFWRSLEVLGTVKIPIKLWKKWLRLRRDGEVAYFRG